MCMLVAMMAFAVNGAWADCYKLIKSANELEVGAEYLLVNFNTVAQVKALGAVSSNLGSVVDVNLSSETITISNEDVAILTLGGTTDAWTLITSKNSNKYLAYTKAKGTTKNNYLFLVDNATTNGSTWKISVQSTGQATITNVYNTERSLQFNSDRFCCYTSSQSPIALYKKEASFSSAVATATTIDATGITNTDVYTSTAAGSLSATVNAGGNAVTGASVTWSGDNNEVATIDASTGVVTLVAAGTVTFTATYAGVTDEYQESSATYEMTVTSSAPYVQPTNVIINMNYEWLGSNNGSNLKTSDLPVIKTDDNVTTTISDGTSTRPRGDTDYIRLYNGSTLSFDAPSGYNITQIVFTTGGNNTWNAPTANSGTLSDKTWTGASNSVTFTLSGSCFISKATITLTQISTKPSITITPATANHAATDDEGTLEITYANLNITDMSDFDIEYYDADGNALGSGQKPAWIEASVSSQDPSIGEGYVVSYLMDENTSTEARSAYFKTYALDNDLNVIYSNLVIITQAGVPVDYATLPFIWAGGTNSDLTATNGVTANGLGSDYAATNAPYRIKFDNTGDYIQVKTNTQPGIAFVDVKMLGGATASKITVQESANGEDFSDVEELTISGSQNDVLTLETSTAFAATTRYVRFLFTKGSNVGVGPITITKPMTLNAKGYATIASTKALDFSAAAYTAWVVTGVEGEAITFTQVTEAPAETGLLLKGTAGQAITLTTTESASLDENNLLEAIITATAVEANAYYGLSGDQFVKVNAGTVPAGKALLPANALNNNVKSFTFVFDGADGIRTVETVSAEEAQAIFNLAGQRLPKAQRGVNIINGKKVIIK